MIISDSGQLVVEELVVEEVKASSAIMYITVRGSSYVAADVAMRESQGGCIVD